MTRERVGSKEKCSDGQLWRMKINVACLAEDPAARYQEQRKTATSDEAKPEVILIIIIFWKAAAKF